MVKPTKGVLGNGNLGTSRFQAGPYSEKGTDKELTRVRLRKGTARRASIVNGTIGEVTFDEETSNFTRGRTAFVL
jgi:hypothetical protein